jgi:hypothetical protein
MPTGDESQQPEFTIRITFAPSVHIHGSLRNEGETHALFASSTIAHNVQSCVLSNKFTHNAKSCTQTVTPLKIPVREMLRTDQLQHNNIGLMS